MVEQSNMIRGYIVHEELDRGGFGVVYRATQSILKREVALKAILPQYANEADFIRRFEREAELVASLEHPYIVPLFDYWRDPNGAFLAMRLIRGGSLRDAIAQGPLSLRQVLAIFESVGSALDMAHRKGIIHRDIKPANILLDEESNAYLTDFGIAKNPNYRTETNVGMTGTLLYAAPEQINEALLGPYTDIYSMGMVLYEALAGEHPFADKTIGPLLLAVLHQPLPPLREARPDLPEELEVITQRATAKDPADRYPNVREMVAALRALPSDVPQVAGSTAPPTERLPLLVDNPYKGLRAFQEADHSDFHGREALTDDLLARLEGSPNRFMAVVGPSGSGKSSVVRAGMLPRLREGAIPGSADWFIVVMLPGNKPFVELEAALMRVAVNTPNGLLETLRAEDGITRALRQILPDESAQLLLVIDQFEELFTLVESEETRTQFIDNLVGALRDARGRLCVVVTIRADFLDRPLYYDDLGQLISQHNNLVLPLSASELNDAIRKPAENIGAAFETGLLDRIIQDVQGQPGALPLLQYALLQLFERRRGSLIPLEAYSEIGGVGGALARKADEVYGQLGVEAQMTARQFFLRLITLGEGTEDTRRRVGREEVAELPFVDEVLTAFGEARLLTFDYDPITRAPTVEVAHEALIRNWGTLRDWLSVAREDLRILARLRIAASEWRAAEREESYLASGLRLREYDNWVDITSLVLSAEESEFLNESIAHEEALREREEARKAEQARIARRAQNFQRASFVLSVLVVAALVAVAGAIGTTIGANNQVATATAALGTADSQQTMAAESLIEAAATSERLSAEGNSILLAAQARDLTEQGNTPLGLRMAYEASNLSNPPAQSQNVLRELAYAPGVMLELDTDRSGTPTAFAFSPDGTQLLMSFFDETIVRWDAVNETVIDIVETDGWIPFSFAFAPDGTQIAAGYEDNLVTLWDLTNGQVLQRFEANHEDIEAIAISPDGRTVATGGDGTSVAFWDVATGTEQQRFERHTVPIRSIAFSPDGRTAASADDRGTVLLYDLENGTVDLFVQFGTYAFLLAFTPDGATLLIGEDGYRLFDVATGEELRSFADDFSYRSRAFSADGSRLLTGDADGTIAMWDVATGSELVRFQARQGVLEVSFTPDGTDVVVGLFDGTVQFWDLANGAEINRLAPTESVVISQVSISPDNTRIAGIVTRFLEDGSFENSTTLWDTHTGEELWRVGGEGNSGLAFTPDGSGVFTGIVDLNAVTLLDVTSGAILQQFTNDHEVSAIAISPDGSLLAAGSPQGVVKVWDVVTNTVVQQLEGVPPTILHMDISPNGDRLIMADSGGNIILWDLGSGDEIQSVEVEANFAAAMAFSPDGRFIIVGDSDGTLVLWDAAMSDIRQRFIGHTGPISAAVFSIDGAELMTTSGDASTIVWDVATGAALRRFAGSEPNIAGDMSSTNSVIAVSAVSTIVVYRNDDLAQLQQWVRENRHLPELSCDERRAFNLAPCVDDAPPPTPTFVPTRTPFPAVSGAAMASDVVVPGVTPTTDR